ncbi:hypothetical protein [Serratia fonticola]|uniref:hypothetical protein n=1 Tax=Serratia fonticola TaxID=47917 RepID=UPI0015C61434|nr:hypothetical protein [Serratia fonticola]MBC3250886.1 hypothetical protein [Serratia fonticola]MDQ7208683.1 hypothetical protein [Serratia fonticola]NYA44660.1 hypothetical protein [Serratia fonticola]HBE9083042.1 hypothetical protein [Serratia fonticola]HBE9093545.1 hypothetical protein [Serratia fonticola]
MNEKLGIPLKVWNGIEFGSYIEIAQEVQPKSDDTKRWIALYALQKMTEEMKNSVHSYDFIKKSKDFMYCVVDFEIPIRIIEFNDGVDVGDAVNLKYFTANTEDELVSIFKKEGINPELFVPPWRCDYPT